LPNWFIERFNVKDVTKEIDFYLKEHGLSFQSAEPLSERTEFPRTITYDITESYVRVRTFFVYRSILESDDLTFFYNCDKRQRIYARKNHLCPISHFESSILQVGTFKSVEDALNDAKARFLNVAVKGEAALEEAANNYASFEQEAMKIIRYVLSKYRRSENHFNTVNRKLNELKSKKENVEALSLDMARPLGNLFETVPNITRESIEEGLNRNEFIVAISSNER
jgi:hypothetical protein